MDGITQMKLLIWDFDNTLAYRDGKWSGTLLEVLSLALPNHTITREQIRSHLQQGLPWHTPEIEHCHLSSADLWWEAMYPVFVAAYTACGIEHGQAQHFARAVRVTYCNPIRWHLFDDTLPTLRHLQDAGWQHVVLSNHVPELPIIIENLQLQPYLATIYNSAVLGYEKPHRRAFQAVLDAYPDVTQMWMIGDNWNADIVGATALNIPAILVRTHHPDAQLYCEDISAIPSIIAPSHG